MQLEIQARNFSLTRAIHGFTKRRMHFSFSKHFSKLKCVIVRLTDINGPKGGRDKRCQIQVVLPGLADTVVEHTAANLYAAIDRAAERASQSVDRKLNRRRERLMGHRHAIRVA